MPSIALLFENDRPEIFKLSAKIAPPYNAELFENVELITVALKRLMAPPYILAKLSLNMEFETVWL